VLGDLFISLDSADNNFLQFNPGEWGIGRLIPVPGSTTKFDVEFKTDILHHFCSFSSEIPPLYFEFQDNTVNLLLHGVLMSEFVRNATIDTFPVIPWDPTSCGPK